MNVLLVKPGKYAREAEIDGSLAGMQAVVGGTIEATYPFEEPVAIICNDEGLLLGLPLNRKICDGCIIAGTFFVCGLGEENFADLSPELMAKFKEMLRYPQMFFRVNGEITSVSYQPE